MGRVPNPACIFEIASELFSWLREPGSFVKIVRMTILNSLWFLVLYTLWYFGFFLSRGSLFEILRHFWGWIIVLPLVLLPCANIVVLGYCKRYALELTTKTSAPFPAMRDPVTLLQFGGETVVLLMIVFSPSIINLMLAVFSFSRMHQGDVFVSLERSFLVIFFLLLASIFSLFSWAVFPVCFFRGLEDRNLRWALDLSDLWKDCAALGLSFFSVMVGLTVAGFMAEGLLVLVCVLMAVSPLGGFFSGAFFILASSLLFLVLTITWIRHGIVPFLELHYL